jgi:hypothetical protein
LMAEKSDEARQTITALGSREPARRLTAATSNQFALAQELYASGLLRSSQRILAAHPAENSQYFLLKAHLILELGQGSRGSLGEGSKLLLKGIALSPERTELRKLAQTVYEKLGDKAGADEQGSKIEALESGRI